jgi:hypothetical protein
MTKKNDSPSKWDMNWKRPRKTKTNWKIPKSIWIIVGLLILFTGITLATNFSNEKNAQPKTNPDKPPQKVPATAVTQQQSSTPILAVRIDKPSKKEKTEKQDINKSEDNQTNTNTNNESKAHKTPKENPPKSEPEVKTVYVYRDRPTMKNQGEPKTPTPKTTTPKTTPPKTKAPKTTPKTTPKEKPKTPAIDKRNVLKNSGFESGRLDYWDSWSPDGQGVVHAVVKDSPASGKYDLVHWHNRDYKQMSYQRLYNLPNGTYTLKGLVRSSKGQADLKLGVKDFDNTTSGEEKFVQLNMEAEPSKWKEFRVDNVVIRGGEAIVFTYSVAKAGQWADFDNLSFYRVK